MHKDIRIHWRQYFRYIFNHARITNIGDIMGEMCGSCRSVLGVLVLAAGAVLFGNVAFGMWKAQQVAGGLFVLVGLGKLMHVGNMCPMCSGKK